MGAVADAAIGYPRDGREHATKLVDVYRIAQKFALVPRIQSRGVV